MTEVKRQNNPYPLGAAPEGSGIRFSFVSACFDAGILLYDAADGKRIDKIPFAQEDRIGNIYCKTILGLKPEKIRYQFYQGEEVAPDRHGRKFTGGRAFGHRQDASAWQTGFLPACYDWEADRRPQIPYREAVFYGIHVRGFTKHPSSGVAHRGTFLGIMEKIPYLKEIGVTTLELQPAYEFVENGGERDSVKACGQPFGTPSERDQGSERINYWGYQEGFYYAPKASYAAGADAPAEFRELIKALHRNGLELVMQFYFPVGVNRNEVVDILRFWALEYHVDGFRLMGERLPVELAAADEMLADRKILYDYFEPSWGTGSERGDCPHLAEYNDGYLHDMRRFLKGDENMLGSVLRQMRYLPANGGRVHYMTNYCGFTLADLVSYDHKHNEENGEENRDGCSDNNSWNCGEEGPARNRRIRALRTRQIKNAMCMLMLTQSTPSIFMGDEFGNSQKGNNNPWCQDNATTWLEWGAQKKNRELLDFFQKLTTFRKAHPVLRPERELRLMDTISCGYPDLSYHGESAWSPRIEGAFHHVGIMLCGKYAKTEQGTEDAFLYIGMNMHWLPHRLALPRLPRGMRWETVADTAEDGAEAVCGAESAQGAEAENLREIPPRSVVVLLGSGQPVGQTGREKKGETPRRGAGKKEKGALGTGTRRQARHMIP